MKKITNRKADLTLIVSILVAYTGFKLVTQSGQEGVVIQNDGYAMTGGVTLIAAGIIFGVWLRSFRK